MNRFNAAIFTSTGKSRVAPRPHPLTQPATLAIAVLCACAAQAEVVVSPSIRAHTHWVDVQSDQAVLERRDTIYGLDGMLDAQYEGPWVLGSAGVAKKMYRYNSRSDADLSLTEYSARLKTGPMSEQLKMEASWDRKQDLLNAIRGSFSDDIFARDNGFLTDNRHIAASYQVPEHWDIDAVASWKRHDNWTLNELMGTTSKYRVDTTSASVGQYTGNPLVNWRLNVEWQDTYRNKRPQYQSTDRDGEVSVPLEMDRQWRLVGTHAYSLYQSTSLSAMAFGDEGTRYESYGLGLSWRSESQKSFAQITRDRDIVRKQDYWSGKFRYLPNRESYVEGGTTRRFYGSSSFAGVAYQWKDTLLKISRNDDVSLQYMLSPTRVLLGIYKCPVDAADDDVSACLMVDDLNVQLRPDEALRPSYETQYPLMDRLSLQTDTLLSLEHAGLRWHTLATYSRGNTQDLEFELAQKREESSVVFTRGKGRQREYQFSWEYRERTFMPSEISSHERLYGVSYQYNLNRNAYWKVALQHINQSTSNQQYDYRDNRISLFYTHHFGSKNIRLKEPER